MTLYTVRYHSIKGIKRKVITTTLDDFTGDAPSSPFFVPDQHVNMTFRGDSIVLHYMDPICPRCLSRNVSKNGTYMRNISDQDVRIQKYLCNDCSYSFEAHPPGYGYGKHIPDDALKKSTGARLKSSLRKAADMCRIFLNMEISHETVRKSIPPLPENTEKMASSGYFSYDEQYVSIDGVRKYRFLLKDQQTGNFHEDILPDLGESATASFIMDALKRFDIPDDITITTDGYHYRDAFVQVSRSLGVRIRRQRCLFHIMKDLSKKIHDAKKNDDLKDAKHLIGYMFFPTDENMDKLGKNKEAVSSMISGLDRKDAAERILEAIGDLYADEPIIKRFMKFLKKNRFTVFRYLDDPMVNKTNNVAEHHFSVRSELFKKRFKTVEGSQRTIYWYHMESTRN